MGSIQTCLTGFAHPDYFAWLGVFSGFMHDFIQGSELDMVQRKNSTNEHLALLEDKERFHREFRLLFRAIGEEDPSLNHFIRMTPLCGDKGIRHIRKPMSADMTGMYGGIVSMILHSIYFVRGGKQRWLL